MTGPGYSRTWRSRLREMVEVQDVVLVTGAEGFVGHALSQRLTECGAAVRAPLRRDGFDILKDPLDLKGVGHVFHLAARTSVPAAWADPVQFHLVNAHGTMRVLEQCRAHGCSMTYVSGYVYGTPRKLPIAETDVPVANNPYAFSKLMGEEACRFYAATFDVRVSIARPFNIYGPAQDERFVFPVIVNQVVDPRVSEVVVKDLAPKRDYIYIDDVVSGILAIANHETGGIFNIGMGKSYSVGEIIASAMKVSGVSKPVRSTEEPRPNEIMDVLADTAAIRALGWRPETSLDMGMEAMIGAARSRLRGA